MRNLKARTGSIKEEGGVQKWVWQFLAVWILLLIWGVLSTELLPVVPNRAPRSSHLTIESFAPGWAPGSLGDRVFSPWLRWDTLWYLQIARDGYQADQASVAFPPLYPLAARLAGGLLGENYLIGGLLVSWMSCFGACRLLAERAVSRGMDAGKVIRLMLFFPTAFFLFAGYTESLFLLLVLLAWREAESGRWWWVGLVGGAAVLTRFIGVLLVIPLGVIWLDQFRAKHHKIFSILWFLPMPLAYFGWFWLANTLFGTDPSKALHLSWAQHFDLPWVGLLGSLSAIFTQPLSEVLFAYVDILAIAIAWASGFWLLLKRKWPEGLFVLAFVVISLVKVTDKGMLGSSARFIVPLFPIFLYQPEWMGHPVWSRVVLYGSVLLWLFSAAMFFTWNWIG
ncbi:MAG: hypothetical protein JW757_07580 [Anaerolineales bacterium]|nr:hypothetical protein [Anaerolineales bacterium]